MSQCCNKADFNNADFNGSDFYVNPFVNRFVRWFRDLIPHHIKRDDSYKDSNDEGLYERYMLLFGDYIDNEIIPQINCYLCIIDASVADDKYLNHISDSLGNPPDIFGTPESYRNLLSYILSIYKIKGTREAYALFFGILGFEIELTEEIPFTDEYLYDNEGIYDSGVDLATYDQGLCQPCSNYSIKFFLPEGGDIEITDALIEKLKIAIQFNEPINANLTLLQFVVNDEETITIDLTGEID